jgi:hypothetical protein
MDIKVYQGPANVERTAQGAMNMRELMTVLHGVFRDNPARFALAYPEMQTGEFRHPGGIVRVFADYPDDLLALAHMVDHHGLLDFKVKVKAEVQKVPDDFGGPWVEYRRMRVPNQKSRLEKCREWCLGHVETLPHFDVHSRSTGQYFTVFVEPMDGVSVEDATPDSYGLSVKTRSFALPSL